MKMTIAEEPRQLVLENFAAHEASGRAQIEEMRRGTATYKGVPIKFGYLPKYFSEEGYAKLKEDLETGWRILVRVIEEYLDREDYRAMFGFPPELEEMILNRPDYRTLLPDPVNAELYRTYRNTLLYREMDEKYEQREFELFDSWVETFLSIWRETGRRPAAAGALPAVAIVDFLEKGSSSAEFDAFREAFARAGCPAYVAEIRDLRYEDGRLLTVDGHVIDAVYRRAVTSDIMAHRGEVQAFLQAARDRNVVLIGDFCTQVVHDKVLFRILHDPRTAAFLTPEENAYIAAHVPYTAILTKKEAARADVRDRKDRWIIKPRDSYGAHGIYPGRQCTEDEWRAMLDAHADTDYILQEFVEPYRTDNIYFGVEGTPEWQSFSNMTGVYLYGGRLAGIYSRASVTPIISVEGDEHEMTSIILRKRS